MGSENLGFTQRFYQDYMRGGAVGPDEVERCAAEGQYHRLIEIAENIRITLKVREAAGFKVLDRCARNGWYSTLLRKMAMNEKMPKKVREAAGLEAVGGYGEKDYYNTLEDIAVNENIPPKARKAAISKLELRAAKNSERGISADIAELRRKHRETMERGKLKKQGKQQRPQKRATR